MTQAKREYWLKALGFGDRPPQDDWRSWGDGVLERATFFSRRPQVKIGDKLVYYAAGEKRIFALAEVRSLPYKKPHEGDPHFPWRVDLDLEEFMPRVSLGIPVNEASVAGRKLSEAMRRRGHIRLRPAEYEAIEMLLRRPTP